MRNRTRVTEGDEIDLCGDVEPAICRLRHGRLVGAVLSVCEVIERRSVLLPAVEALAEAFCVEADCKGRGDEGESE